MKVLADHCVPEGIVRALRAEGLEVLRVVDLVDPRAPDRDVAALAQRHGALLLTADSDFARRRDFPPRRFGGIVVLQDLDTAPERVMRRLLRVVRGRQRDLNGAVVILDRRSQRVRRA